MTNYELRLEYDDSINIHKIVDDGTDREEDIILGSYHEDHVVLDHHAYTLDELRGIVKLLNVQEDSVDVDSGSLADIS